MPSSNGLMTLVQFATGVDRLLTIGAAVFATGAGVTQGSMLFAIFDIFDVAGAATLTGGVVDMGRVMDTVYLLFLIGGVVGFACFCFFSLGGLAAAHQKAKWRKALVKAVLRQDVGWFDVSNPQELTTKMSESIEAIYKGLDGPSYMLFLSLGLSTMGFTIGFTRAWDVSLVMVSIFPLVVVSGALMARRLMESAKRRAASYYKAGGIASECLYAMRTVASFGLEGMFEEKYAHCLQLSASAEYAQGPYTGFVVGLTLASFMLLQVAGFFYSGYQVGGEIRDSQFPYSGNGSYSYCAHGNNSLALITEADTCPDELRPWLMTCALAAAIDNMYKGGSGFEAGYSVSEVTKVPTAAAFQQSVIEDGPASYLEENASYYDCLLPATTAVLAVFAIVNGAQGFVQVGQPMLNITKAIASAQSLSQILDRKSEIDPFEESGATLPSVRGDVEVRDVVFAYPTAPEHIVCKGYSLSVTAGQTCALCGPSGSGKSTIIALLERFYNPQEGELLLDGVNIKTLNVRWLRQQLGLVAQEPVLFMGTVSENIAHGKPGATQAEIEEAAKQANAHTFIVENLGDGYNTDVGQGGNRLSGGQKQRVAIARALIKRPAVLLLDEATSALDNESERVVQAALDEIMAKQKRTTIVIAHRLSTIRNADTIAVVHEGKVVEKGSYDGLMQNENGRFYQLALEQQRMAKRDSQFLNGHEARDVKKLEAKQPEAVRQVHVVSSGPVGKGPGTTTREGNVVIRVEADEVVAAPKGGEGEKSDAMTPAAARKRLAVLHRESRCVLALGAAFAAVSACLPMVGFYFMANFFEVLFRPNPDDIEREATLNCIFVLCICLGIVLATTGDVSCFNVAGVRLTTLMRKRGMNAFLRQDISFFDIDSNSAGDLTTFLAEKVTTVQSLTNGSLSSFVRIVSCIGTLIVICFIFGPWQLSLSLLGLYPMVGGAIGFIVAAATGNSGKVKNRSKGGEAADESQGQAEERTAGALIGEVVLAIRTVASLNAEQKLYEDYCRGVDAVMQSELKQGMVNGIAVALGNASMMLIMGFMFWYGQYLFSIGETDFTGTQIPPLMMFASVMVVITAAVQVMDVPTALIAAKVYFDATERQSAIDPFEESGATLPSVRGDVEVRDVVFAYPTAPEHIVCKGYSLSVTAGQTCALCGPSGSGKSTIIALLERFYDPQEGELLLDGVNIKTLNVRWLRQQLGLVGQEPVLFMGSVSENIAHGKPGATQAEIEEAAKQANAHTFIVENLGDGYNTDVGQRGGQLSGGQKQRIAIARALIKRPTVLLLDEATSALDNESERVVQAALDEIMAKQKRTTIVIAHRLSTIRNADTIAVVHEGRVVEKGSHEHLLAQGGMYAKLAIIL
ncbi:hypothetical protein AB1Y20_022868 [Prymnesium parvum]|uniref:Bile salt export pump n=1 Tax=Prymnesium parvum TaxID=97485 RepID=A0AB34JDX3_PRYPA